MIDGNNNIVLYAIGFGMVLVGDVRSAMTVVGLVIFNAVVGIIQEVRSKRKLDEIALLASTLARKFLGYVVVWLFG